MAHFNFRVDTEPMATSLDGVTHHVDGTTAAVVAMQSAVVIAEQQGAEKISSNVNFGFYSLIRSQISQKIAVHKSKADAKIMELHQQSISLASIKTRMERDYMMLANRYSKLFDSLNKELQARVYEIDRPTTNFVNKEVLPIALRTMRLSGTPSVTQHESIGGSQLISVSNTKFNAMRNISSMKDFIFSSETQKSLIGSILFQQHIDSPKQKYIPIIISESEGLNVRQKQFLVTQSKLAPSTNARIESHAYSSLSELRWHQAISGNSRVKQEYGNLVNQSSVSERVKKRMHLFMESSDWLQLN